MAHTLLKNAIKNDSRTSTRCTPPRKVSFVTRLRRVVCGLLEIREHVTWRELKRVIRHELGRGWNSHLREAGLRGLKHWCKTEGYVLETGGISLAPLKAQKAFFTNEEKTMTIAELKRHRTEKAIYVGTRKAQTGLPKDICRYIGDIMESWNAFESKISDYHTTQVFRSERGLEKANGNLYEVRKAIHTETGKEVTLELFEVDESGDLPSFLVRELEMNHILHKHPNIWQIVDEINIPNQVVIVRQYVKCTLSSVITKSGRMEEEKIKDYLRQMFRFVFDCHRNNIICDGISSGSIYVDDDEHIKITRNPANFYDPPERLLADSEEKKNSIHSSNKDIWALGCVFAKMVLGKWLFGFDRSDTNDIDVLMKIFKTLGTPTYHEWPQAHSLHQFFNEFPHFKKVSFAQLTPRLSADGQDLLSQMLCHNPEHRITAMDALNHPFLQENKNIIE